MKTKYFNEFNSLSDLESYFKNERVCRDYLSKVRWNQSVICPYCGHSKVYNRRDGRYACAGCARSFSVLVGTVFQNTKLSLLTWFKAIYLICNSKQGISSCQLKMLLGVTQKTAWFILHKIRILMKNTDDEYDDKVQGKIVSRVSKKGKLYKVRQSYPIHEIHPVLMKYVKSDSRIFSDEYLCYQSMIDSEKDIFSVEDPYPLILVNKTIDKQLVVDAFWLQLKRMVMGIGHFLSSSHFHRYVYEALFRKKYSHASNHTRFAVLLTRTNKIIPYKKVRPVN
ncbi:MAG: transposase [Bacteroidales bacterium]|nr:transposase [Bacteroidales bacterium]